MKPKFQITVNGLDATKHIKDRLISAKIIDKKGDESDRFELVLDDRDNKIPLPPENAVITASMGTDKLGLTPSRVFVLDGVDVSGPPDKMTILGNATSWSEAAQASMQSRKTRHWEKKTLGAIVAAIAGEHGYSPKIDGELASIFYENLDQSSSDINFLSKLAKDHDAIVRPAYGKLMFYKPKPKGTVTIDKKEAADWSAATGQRAVHKRVVARWLDMVKNEQKEVTMGSGEPVFIIHDCIDEADAKRKAQARFYRDAREKAGVFVMLEKGKPSIEAEMNLNLTGFRSGINGTWFTTEVVHSVSQSGYTTSVKGRLPG